MKLEQIQSALKDFSLDGWLFFDHHHRDPIGYRLLGLPSDLHASRRWYYFIPRDGQPRKLVSRIEPHNLASLPGETHLYSAWTEQQSALASILPAGATIAMQYSSRCAIPYVAMVDAGTIELVTSCGVHIVSSADLVARLEASWSEHQLSMHLEAVQLVEQTRKEAFRLIRERIRDNANVSECEVQAFIQRCFSERGLITDHGPIVAANAHAGNPHFEPSRDRDTVIKRGDFVLIDMWAKLDQPDAVYADITWNGFCGDNVPAPMENVFGVVRDARNAATDLVKNRTKTAQLLKGFEVDDAARNVVNARGFGHAFIHRTGHSIGTDVHGNGANMDNFESHDERLVIPHTCFSVEPGIYLNDFGVRSEVDVFVASDGAIVTTEQQQSLEQL